jgi:O-antigen/teichoic acid export membrane protein
MNKLLSYNILGMILVKVIAMAINFSVIPLYLIYFEGGKSELGQWLIFFTILTVLVSFDFGISSRLKNDLLLSETSWDSNITKAVISNVFIASIVVMILLIVKEFKLVNFISNIDVHKFHVIISFLLLISPFKVTIPILQAKQKNWLSAFVIIIPQIFILMYLSIFKGYDVEQAWKINMLLYVLCSMTFICYSICFFILIKKYKIIIMLQKAFYSGVFEYTKSSFTFFVTQLCLIILITMNDLIYGLLGTESLVVDYQYYFRVYSFVFVSFSSITVPFWSAIRHQYVHKNYKSVKELIIYLFALLAPTIIIIVIISFYLQYFFDFWLGPGVHITNLSIVICFSILSLSMCLMYVFTAILNSLDEILFQAKTLLYAAFIKIIIIFLSRYFDIMLDIVILSSVISMVFVSFLLGFKTMCVCKKIRIM